MILQMVGIDYEKADLDIREIFSFHKHASLQAMEQIQSEYEINGVVLISTCNRTELYVSSDETVDNLFEMLCFVKNISAENYHKYAIERKGHDAIDHLFQLSCGLKSKIFGEDQIISQVKNALMQAREVQTTDSFLEKVFQTAVSAAKKVKTEVHLTAIKTSVIEEMLNVLKRDLGTLNEKKCMVIGNGEIGRLAAERMLKEKSNVTMTVRSYKTREVEVPKGCKTVDYKERYHNIADYDIVISATASPHHTIKYEDSYTLFEDGKQHILVDLAVPRDISSRYEQVENIILYNIDTLGGVSKTMQDNEALAHALSIIKEQEEELEAWENFRVYVPAIKMIGYIGGMVTYKRLEKDIKKVIEPFDEKKVETLIRNATEKTITSMLFDLRKNLPMEYWQVCMEAFEKNMIKEE